jgi:hypothetical protein
MLSPCLAVWTATMITAGFIHRFCTTILLAVLFAMLNRLVHRHYFLPLPTQLPTTYAEHSTIFPQSGTVYRDLWQGKKHTLCRGTHYILI